MKIFCQRCTMRCEITVLQEGDKVRVSGNLCQKGEEFAKNEMVKAKRNIYIKLPVSGGYFKEVPVKSSGEIPKESIEEVMKILEALKLEAPIEFGEIIVENILGTGVDIISDRKI